MASTMILILGILSVVSGQIMEGMVQLDKFSIDKVSRLESDAGCLRYVHMYIGLCSWFFKPGFTNSLLEVKNLPLC